MHMVFWRGCIALKKKKKHVSCDCCVLYPKLNSVKLDKIMARRRYTEIESGYI